MSVLRVKVEGHGCIGIPQTTLEYKNVCKYINKTYSWVCNPYFEFHIKVANAMDFNKLECSVSEIMMIFFVDVGDFASAAVSYNMCSANRKPLLTVRVFNNGFINARKYKDIILNHLKDMGYIFENKIQEEFSIYDSNSNIDKGWLLINYIQ
jgi:hypothetical protein